MMRFWGRSFRRGHRYTRLGEVVWSGNGWRGCLNHSRHWWRLMA